VSERGGWRAAADIGGTFTDLVLVDREGRCAAVAKLLTSADDPARSVTEGLDRLLADAGVDGQSLEVVVHGTTLVANALIERRGADRVGHPVSLRTTTISEAQRWRAASAPGGPRRC